MALRSSLDDESLAAKLTAVLALVGVAILPIIKFSVEWWNTLHQPSTGFTKSVDPSMRTPLLVMALGFTLLFIAMHMIAMRNEVLRRRVKAMRLREIERRDGAARCAERGRLTSWTWISDRTRHSSGPVYADRCARRRRSCGWLVYDGRRQRAALADLEARGVKRRSAQDGHGDGAMSENEPAAIERQCAPAGAGCDFRRGRRLVRHCAAVGRSLEIAVDAHRQACAANGVSGDRGSHRPRTSRCLDSRAPISPRAR